MCGRIAMMQVCCPGQWYMETYYMADAASTILHSCMHQQVPTSPKQPKCCGVCFVA